MAADNLCFNPETNCAELRISKEIYLRILNKAIQQTKVDLPLLRAALDRADYDVVQTISHRLKGDYDNLRVSQLSQIARSMNNLVKAGDYDTNRLNLLFEDLSGFFLQLSLILLDSKPFNG